MSRAMVLPGYSPFEAGEESIEDAEQRERRGTTKTNENNAPVAAVLKDNRLASCRMIVESMGIWKTIVHCILSDLKKKLCARFVPHALTAEQREQCIVHAKYLLEMIAHDPNFLNSIITGEKSWCFSYDPETNK